MKWKTPAAAVLGMLCWLLSGCLCLASEPEHTLQFFYENVCASCHTEDTFYDLFNRCISTEEKAELSYEIRTYNIFLDASLSVYEELLAEAGLERTDHELPVLVVDGEWISGYDAMEERLQEILVGEPDEGTEQTAGGEDEEQTAGGEDEEQTAGGEDAGQTAGEDGTEPEADRDSGASAKAQDFVSALAELGLGDEDPAILLFTTYSCEECEAAKTYLEELGEEFSFATAEYLVAQGENLLLFKELLEIYGRSQEEGKVPAVFAGTCAYLGKEEIEEGLETLLAEGGAGYGLLKEMLGKVTGEESVSPAGLAAMFGAGLLAGFNPCSVSMLLMLFSILLTSSAPPLRNGLLYLAGKYVTYLGIGLLICLAASRVEQGALERFGGVLNGVIVALFLAAAGMNFLDFWNVRRQEYGKVRMQLPQRLRRFNHRLLKKTGQREGLLLSLLVLGLGAAISLGEFFCTGQIYMASILYLLREGSENVWFLLGSLTVYVTAMCIPAAGILLVIVRTRGTQRVSDFMLRHMAAIKLLNSVLFAAYAAYFVWKLLRG